jgi:hypothetical protein
MKLKKILQEIGQSPRYSAVLLDDKSKNLLIENYKDKFPSDWKIYAHHQTIDPFGLVREDLVGTPVNLLVTHYGKSDKAFAVKVSGYKGPTNNAFPHVTIAVNVNGGGKPKDSNSITDWIKEQPIHLTGTIQNL